MVPTLLTKILVMITFHWDLSKLTLLRIALSEIVNYRHFTDVDIVIVTDKIESLQHALTTFDIEENIIVWEFNSSSPQYTGNKYDMLWEHRVIVDQEMKLNNHTTFMYIEDDTFMPWPHLVSWAIDTEMLEPLGFTRGIFRTEINEDGFISLNDFTVPLANNLGCTLNLTVDKTNPHFAMSLHLQTYDNSSGPIYKHVHDKYSSHRCHTASTAFNWYNNHHNSEAASSHHQNTHNASIARKELQSCPVHEHFVQMYSPFQGMWLLSRTQTQAFMRHAYWNKGEALKRDTRRPGQANWNWGYPERSNSMNIFVDVPSTFFTNNVVPYTINEDHQPILSNFGRAEHIRNAYRVICTMDKVLTY